MGWEAGGGGPTFNKEELSPLFFHYFKWKVLGNGDKSTSLKPLTFFPLNGGVVIPTLYYVSGL